MEIILFIHLLQMEHSHHIEQEMLIILSLLEELVERLVVVVQVVYFMTHLML